jgi:predicted ATPase/transcriptional regulator with XRE-family HTH domain
MSTPQKGSLVSSGTAFGAWLKQRRNALGLAQKELAECAGCSVVTIEKIESSARRPSSQIAEMLAECLKVPSDERLAFIEFARAHLSADRLALLADADDRAPWRTLYRRSTNLPSPRTAFIGREKEIAAACALLRQPGVRLLSLTGPPGIGKTRLSLRVAEELMEDYEGSVYFVELAPVQNPDLVVPAIADALGSREVGGESLLQNLKRHLGDKRTLLVLDNFEQVVAAAYQVGDLLTSSPWLKVLVSSREILHIYGEHELQVPSLHLPAMRYLPPVERLVAYEAVRLFTERAVAVRSDFILTPENAPAVVEICTRLDKVPLAIELAAARARTLTPLEIVKRLDSNLELLTGGARDLPPRQRALRSAIDWSYDLLNEMERQLFRRMSVFVGGCTLQAVEAVCTSDTESDSPVIMELGSLVDKNLVRQEEINEAMRYSMLQTIREYAWWRLVGRGEDATMRRCYAAYYVGLAKEAKAAMKGPQQLAWLGRLELEHNNLRAVLGQAIESGDAETALELAGTLWRFWLTHGHLTEGRKWLVEALEIGEGGPDPVLADALNGAGNLACACGDFEAAQPLYERSLEIRRRQGDKAGIASSLNNLALTANTRCDFARVKALHEESLAIKREMGDRWGIASSLGNLAISVADQGDYARARVLHEESLELRRELGDRLGIALSLINLGVVMLAASLKEERPGDLLASAEALFEESLAIRRELVDRPGIAECLVHLGEVQYCRENYAKAAYLYQQSLEICQELGDKPGISGALLNLGYVDVRHGDLGQARARFRESLTIRRQLSDARGLIDAMAAMAGLASALGKAHLAGRLSGATEATLRTTGYRLYTADRIEYERHMAAARSKLGEDAWLAALSEGALMSLNDAADEALRAI